MKQHDQVEHMFRHEYGPLVATLTRRVGVQHLSTVEDAVQHALMQALSFWNQNPLPNNPSAWLYKVAYRQLISVLRTEQRRQTLRDEQSLLFNQGSTEDSDIPLPGEMGDALLRMLFVTCHEDLPLESQLVFTLKSLCGFSIMEISVRLFITKDNAYKRFNRAKQFLQSQPQTLDSLNNHQMLTRLPMVHKVLYLVFTEGYLSTHEDMAIRKDLCEEAIHLTLFLRHSAIGKTPATYALLALMNFHVARMHARQDDSGALLLLEQQDRQQWDKQQIIQGFQYLSQSALGKVLTRYHVEASIAAEHCLAPTFNKTAWGKIVASYELLNHIAPSVLHGLNRAVAMAEHKNPQAGLLVLQSLDIPIWLERSYYWYAVQADLQYRNNQLALAQENAIKALQLAPTNDIKKLLHTRLKKYGLPPLN